MSNVTEVIARIGAENAQLKRVVADSLAEMRKLESAAARAGKSSASSLKSIDASAASLSRTLERTKSTMLGVVAATGATKMIGGVFDAAKSAIVDFNSILEQTKIGFTTMLGSAQAADRYISGMKTFAAKTPFEFPELVQSSQRMLALGFSAKSIMPSLTAVGDAVSALGGTMANQGNRVILALGQMGAKGKVSAEEMRQLSEAGINGWKYLGDAMGITAADAMEKAKKSFIDGKVAVDALLQGMKNDFGGMMEAQSKTLMGAMSTVKDYARMISADATRPLYNVTRDGVLNLAKFLSSSRMQSMASTAAKSMAKGFDAGFSQIGQLVDRVRPIVVSLFESFDAHKSDIAAIGESFMEVGKAIGSVVDSGFAIAATMAKIAPPVVIGALKVFAATLEQIANLIESNTTVAGLLAAAFVGFKLVQLTTQFTQFSTKLADNARKHLTAAAAANAHLRAERQLAAAQASTARTAIGGAMPGAAGWGLGISAAKATATAASKASESLAGMGRAATLANGATGLLKAGLGSITSFLGGPLGVAMAASTVAMVAWGTNTQEVNNRLDDLFSNINNGAPTATAALENLREAMRRPADSMIGNRDLEYSGGFMSDIGAAFKNVFSPTEWGQSDNGYEKSMEAAAAREKALLKQIADERQAKFDEMNEAGKTWADSQIQQVLDFSNGITAEMDKARTAEIQALSDMANPFSMFADQAGIGMDQMMENLKSNLVSIMSWKDNLTYMMQTGNTDIAAYFAELGPMANQALSELIHGSPEKLAEFRELVKGQFALTGEDAEIALKNGLMNIPGLAEMAGYSFSEDLTKAVEDFAGVAPVVDKAYEAAFNAMIKNAEGVYTEVGNADVSIQQMLKHFTPAELAKYGMTAQALGIPDVMIALGELKSQGEDDPVKIQMDVIQALVDLGYTKEQIDRLIDYDNEVIKIDTDVTGAISKLTNLKTLLASIVAAQNQANNGGLPSGSQRFNPAYNAAKTASNLYGGIYSFANGGTLPSQAKLQRPGTLVQWAEPGTGGESFIPHAPSKRARSLDIWYRTGQILGAVDSFEPGGFRTPAPIKPAAIPSKPKPAPWAFGSTPKGGGSGSGGGSGADTGDYSWIFDLADRMFRAGEIDKKQWLKGAEEELGRLDKYSDEWLSLRENINSTYEDMLNDEKEFNERRKALKDNEDDFRNEMGYTSNDEWMRILEWRLSQYEKYSDEWMSIHRQIEDEKRQQLERKNTEDDVRRDLGFTSDDEWMRILEWRLSQAEKYSAEWGSIYKQIEDEKRRHVSETQSIEDNMYEAGVKSTEEYRRILTKRLDGLTAYSNEWMSIWRQLESLETDAVERRTDVGRSMGDAMTALYKSAVDPITAATSLTSAFGNDKDVTMDSVTGFYSHMEAATTRWLDAIKRMSKNGTPAALRQQVISAGPRSLALAETLASADWDTMSSVQNSMTRINDLSREAGNYALGVGLGEMGTNSVDNSITIGDVTITLPDGSYVNGQLNDEIKGMFLDALNELRTQISSGAKF